MITPHSRGGVTEDGDARAAGQQGLLQSVTVEPWWQENGSADFFFFFLPLGLPTRAERRNFRLESKSAKVLDACKVNCRARIRLASASQSARDSSLAVEKKNIR